MCLPVLRSVSSHRPAGRAGLLSAVRRFSSGVRRSRPCAALVVLVFVLTPSTPTFGLTSDDPIDAPRWDDDAATRDTEPGDPSTRLAPDEAARSFVLPDGFRMTLFAGEPDVRQPIAIAADRHGRLWVVENYTYAEAAVGFERSLRDRIVVLEDVDRDGRSDRRTVFWDQGGLTTSVEIGFGGAWILDDGKLIFVPDADEDLVPDGPPVVLLDGWDTGSVRHNVVNGLRWGPDGWLYGRHGILATSLVGAPGTPLERRTPINCGVWRYHPTEARFEVIARGTTNPWGMDWTEEGELLMINTVIGHLWHVVPGVHFERMYGNDFDPHLYRLMPQTADHIHWNPQERWSDIRNGISDATDRAGGGHAHSGLLIYQETAWPSEYRGDVLAINLHGRRINRDRLEADRAGLVARHLPDPFLSQDPWFRGIDLIAGPDGQVWIADWSDTGECHENDGVSRSSGRIFALSYGDSLAERPTWPESPEGLVDLVIDGSNWWSRRALVALAAWSEATDDAPRRDSLFARAMTRIDTTSPGSDRLARLRALWAANAVRSLTTEQLTRLMNDRDEPLRRWAIRMAVDGAAVDPALLPELSRLAAGDADGLVPLTIASALQRLPISERLSIAMTLAGNAAAVDDRLGLMIWYGIGQAVADDPAKGIEAFRSFEQRELRQFVARRLASDLAQRPELGAMLLAGATNEDSLERRADLLIGMRDGTRGLSRMEPPAGWSEWVAELPATDDSTVRLALTELEALFGQGRSIIGLIDLAADGNLDPATRAQALESLGRARAAEGTQFLLDRVNDRDIGPAAVAALRSVDDERVAPTLIANWESMRPEARSAALATLTARASSARQLLDAVADGRVPSEAVGPYEWRQLGSLGDAELERRTGELWPASLLVFDDRAARDRLAARLTESLLAAGRPEAGHELFAKVCGNCHKLRGEGGTIGPDLTGSQRSNLAYLVENIGAPSAETADAFRTSLIETVDGQVIVGVIVRQLPDRIEVQTKDALQVLERSEIEEVAPSGRSLMPDGLAETLTDQELADLIAYLRR